MKKNNERRYKIEIRDRNRIAYEVEVFEGKKKE